MKARIRHYWEIIAGAILSLLGFSGCSLVELFVPKAEYGMPHADYKLVGTVETETGAPVEGIKVTYSRKEGSYQDEQGKMVDYWYRYETFSDAEGKVSATTGDYREDARDIIVALEDVDGEKNGEFEPLVLEGNDLDISFEKDAKSGWHIGSYTIAFRARLREKLGTGGIIDQPAEYGMPHAEYRVIGTVKDKDGHPIPGIQVLADLWQDGGSAESLGSTLTDASGAFTLHTDWAWPGATVAKLKAEDIDGAANGGVFRSAEASVNLTKTGNGDGRWNEGSFEGSVNITMEKQ